jgi:hypothetical protein
VRLFKEERDGKNETVKAKAHKALEKRGITIQKAKFVAPPVVAAPQKRF